MLLQQHLILYSMLLCGLAIFYIVYATSIGRANKYILLLASLLAIGLTNGAYYYVYLKK